MNLLLKAKAKMFLKTADKQCKSVILSLLKEIENLENDRKRDKIRYEIKHKELETEMWYWKDQFMDNFYYDERQD